MLLELRNVSKRFGGVAALRGANLAVEPGQVHLLMGENGAGKSTLMKIVAGMLLPDSGDVLWKGQSVRFRTPAEAARYGVAMVHQESLLAPHLTVADNIFLGREMARGGFLDRSAMHTAAARLIEEHRFPLKPDWRVDRLSPAGKQMVEICRALSAGSSLLIFDEPTSSLSESEANEVMRIVATLSQRGTAIIYITHRLEELRSIGHHVTVLRDGQTVHSGAMRELSTDTLIRHMVGREVSAIYQRSRGGTPGPERLRVEGLTREPVLHNVSFHINAGEIVGLAGLVGAGRTELCRALFGLDPIQRGRVLVEGRAIRPSHPRDAVAAGIALVPEDRQRTGLARALSIGANLTMANLPAVSPGGLIRRSLEAGEYQKAAERLRIRASGPLQPAGKLSGGNQQKVVIAKWVSRGAKVYLFDEPTRGIDVGAKAEVFQIMEELARGGAALLMISSELPELLQMADRILVMRAGRLVGELPGTTTQEAIMRLAAPAGSSTGLEEGAA